MEIQKYDQPTNLRTDGLTWVGARDTYVSKNGTVWKYRFIAFQWCITLGGFHLVQMGQNNDFQQFLQRYSKSKRFPDIPFDSFFTPLTLITPLTFFSWDEHICNKDLVITLQCFSSILICSTLIPPFPPPHRFRPAYLPHGSTKDSICGTKWRILEEQQTDNRAAASQIILPPNHLNDN